MGQTQRGKPEAPALADGPGGPSARGGVESIGRYLARERRLRGISLQELAATTRIPLRSLERLESGAFDDDPDGFVRGFVRTVARALGLPPEETLSRMLPEVSASAAAAGLGGHIGRSVLLGALALAVIAGGYVLWIVWTAPAGTEVPRAGGSWVYRRDAVRELAREVAAQPQETVPEQAPVEPGAEIGGATDTPTPEAAPGEAIAAPPAGVPAAAPPAEVPAAAPAAEPPAGAASAVAEPGP